MWPVIVAAGIGAIAGEIQGQKNRAAMRRQEEEQKRRDKINMMAQAYGLNGVSNAPMQPRGGEMLQGALGGAQFAVMNENLWADKGTPDPWANMSNDQVQSLINSEAGMNPAVQSSLYNAQPNVANALQNQQNYDANMMQAMYGTFNPNNPYGG